MLMRQPQIASCFNCGAARTYTPCPVCGFTHRKQAVYQVRHDPQTDSYLQPPKTKPLWPDRVRRG